MHEHVTGLLTMWNSKEYHIQDYKIWMRCFEVKVISGGGGSTSANNDKGNALEIVKLIIIY